LCGTSASEPRFKETNNHYAGHENNRVPQGGGGCAAIKQKESWSGKTGFHLTSCTQLLNRRTLSSLAALLFGQQHAFDERINAAVQHIVHIAHIQADAVILDHLVGV